MPTLRTLRAMHLLATASAVITLSSPVVAQSLDGRNDFHIAPQALADALIAFSQTSNVQVVTASTDLGRARTNGVDGSLTPRQALDQLLAGTGLRWREVGHGSIVVEVAQASGAPGTRPGETRPNRLGDAGQASPSSEGSQQAEEIVVTAQKREERLREVPVPTSVLRGDKLAEKNQLLLADYATTVPGFVVAPINFGQQQLAIRGITTSGFTLPTVATMIDGVPYGGLLDVPDIDPGDLARVEVLRGPQGTLYGAGSLSGLVNFVTKEPSFEGYSGHIETGTNVVQNGAGLGYSLRGAANIPVNEKIAFRVSGYSYTDPGYIDDPVHNLQGVNRTDAYGARGSFLLEPFDALSIKFSALYDHIDHKGSSEVDVPTAGYPKTAGLGDLQQNYIPGVGGQTFDVKAFDLTVIADLGDIKLVSLTGYNEVYDPSSFDWSDTFGSVSQKNFGVGGAVNIGYSFYRKITEELRFSGSFGKDIDWLFGGFYSHTMLPGYEVIAAADPNTGRISSPDWILIYPRFYQEIAAFADLTYRITDRFDIQIGGRESQDREYDAPEIQEGPYIGPTPSISPPSSSKDRAFTYLVTPRYKLSQDVMIYARFASGFRPGGPNQHGVGIPPSYQPDRTRNYEIGAKGDFFDNKLSIDASVYYIDWQNIQIQKFSAQNLSFTSNGSSAKSEGAEFSATVRPTEGLSISGWYAYDNAVLTEAFPSNSPLYGTSGARLPLSSQNSFNLSVNERFSIDDEFTGFAEVTERYVGDRLGIFTATSQRQDLPAYAQTDLQVGVEWDSLAATLYVNNLTDKRGVLNGGLGYILPYAFIYSKPRTFGLSVAKDF